LCSYPIFVFFCVFLGRGGFICSFQYIEKQSNVDALKLTCLCVIRLLIIIYALRLFPFLLFRLPNKPWVILENKTNHVSHLFVTVIPSPNALSMCGILSPNVLSCLNPLRIVDIKVISYTHVFIVGTEYDVFFGLFVHSLVFLRAHVSAASLPLSPSGTFSSISYV